MRNSNLTFELKQKIQESIFVDAIPKQENRVHIFLRRVIQSGSWGDIECHAVSTFTHRDSNSIIIHDLHHVLISSEREKEMTTELGEGPLTRLKAFAYTSTLI